MADQKRFLRDVRNHKMTIELDQGVHRCLYFGTPGTGCYHFRITTWPGHLAISGDCGSYTFARLRDMFELFRDQTGRNRVNTSYWSEKLQAVDWHGDQEEVDAEAYVKAIRRCMAEHMNRLTLAEAKDVVREARYDYIFDAPSTKEYAVSRAMNWQCPMTQSYPFEEFWDFRITKPSFRLVWCLRAIVWGIKRYDQHHQGRTQADHDRRVLSGAM